MNEKVRKLLVIGVCFAELGLGYILGRSVNTRKIERGLKEKYSVTNFYQGDLTGDGRNDVVVRQRNGDQTIFIQNQDGSFSSYDDYMADQKTRLESKVTSETGAVRQPNYKGMGEIF